MEKIAFVKARQILDSRGWPTVEVDVGIGEGRFARASVPSGASTGSREALELRDGDDNIYCGKSVLRAVDNIKTRIAPLLLGQDVTKQRHIDDLMLECDGTDYKSNLGANAILAVSMAVSRAAAIVAGKPLYRYLYEDMGVPNKTSSLCLPAPLMNIINGGAHASNNLDIQEFMIVPHLDASFSDNLRAGVEVFHTLKKLLAKQGAPTNVGDEGGFAPNLESHHKALDLLVDAITSAGYRPSQDISLSLDVAASEFYSDGHYSMQGEVYDNQQIADYYKDLIAKYPIYSIEDALDESDHEGWQQLTKSLGDKVVLVGDDLFVTNKKIFKSGIDNGEANAILIKLNQIGTVSETLDTISLAFDSGYQAIISHRSGETEDSFIADLAVATGCGHIKTGAASRSDRTAKYNRLLRIEEDMGPNDAPPP